MEKGISPLVAAVLLIAVTMTIAGILAYWASSFTRAQISAFENQTVTTECSFANFRFYTCKYDSSTGTMSFILDNPSNVNLKDLVAFIIYRNNTIQQIPLDKDLPANQIQSFSISGISSDYSSITIRTHCPGLSVSDDCR